MTKMECPCSRDCPDRSAKCHTKGNCPHKWYEWYEEHEKEREAINKKKAMLAVRYTRAQELRHFNWIKYGDGNTRR